MLTILMSVSSLHKTSPTSQHVLLLIYLLLPTTHTYTNMTHITPHTITPTHTIKHSTHKIIPRHNTYTIHNHTLTLTHGISHFLYNKESNTLTPTLIVCIYTHPLHTNTTQSNNINPIPNFPTHFPLRHTITPPHTTHQLLTLHTDLTQRASTHQNILTPIIRTYNTNPYHIPIPNHNNKTHNKTTTTIHIPHGLPTHT